MVVIAHPTITFLKELKVSVIDYHGHIMTPASLKNLVVHYPKPRERFNDFNVAARNSEMLEYM